MIERIAKSFKLQFQDGKEWRPLPPWAKFFISLGAAISKARSPDRRIVTALSVPTSSYAAAFIALGRILNESISEPAKSAIDAHFEKLAHLPRGTGLIYFNGEALYHGPLVGFLKYDGDDYVRMEIRRGTCMIPKHRCLLVELQPEREKGVPLTNAGRLRNPKPFVGHFFSLVEHYRILCSTTRSVIVVGETNRFRTELIQTPFAVQNDTGVCQGALQDLIRVAKFSSGGVGCRADIYARSREHTPTDGESPPMDSLLILDGAASLIRRAHEYPPADTVAILSRTEADYAAAMDSANARYLSRLDDCALPGLLAPPAGIEFMVHVEARQ